MSGIVPSREVKTVAVTMVGGIVAGALAPLVFVMVVVLRKANRRFGAQYKIYAKRWAAERARWA